MDYPLDDTMAELKALLLAHYTPAEAFEWLFAPHPQMSETIPIMRIQHGGDQTFEVVKTLRRLDDAVYL